MMVKRRQTRLNEACLGHEEKGNMRTIKTNLRCIWTPSKRCPRPWMKECLPCFVIRLVEVEWYKIRNGPTAPDEITITPIELGGGEP